MTSLARAVVPWRAVLLAGALSLLAGAALSRGLLTARSSAVPAVGAGATAHRGLASLPRTAQGPVSAALGAGRAAYRVKPSRGALLASSPVAHLRARFLSTGARLGSGSLKVDLALRAIGFGSVSSPIGGAPPRAASNRVTYAHPGLSEWYANGPLGIEQGFTLVRAPAVRARGPLTLTLALSGNGRATLAASAHAITIAHGSSSLRYGGLAASDASGRALNSWLELRGGAVLIRVDARGARYPLRIDPLVQQGGKLVPSDEETESEAGTSVAISADGNTALIGGIGDKAGTAKDMVGAAWVFTRAGGTWKQQGPKLTGSDEEGEGQFGIGVALSADGNTALIGGINDETGGKQVGAAWVFTRSGSTWSQQGAKLTGGGEEGLDGRFGKSVALSADGNTALIGAYFDENSKKEPQSGSAFVFTRSGSTWKHQGPKLTGSDEGGIGQFGISVALSADGNTALIGGPDDEGAAKLTMAGAAWVFTRSASSWTQEGPKLTGSGETGAGELGWSVALSADGNTALAGAPGDGDGAAFAFARSGASWSQQGSKLVPSDATIGAGFGAGVALSADGTVALIGGPVDKDSIVPTGAVWEFGRSGSSWSQQGAKVLGAGEVPESEFGAAVSLSADGATALVGGPIDDTKAGAIGAAWVFVNPPPTVTTGGASSIGSSTATLSGTVDPGASVRAYFQYGTTAAYGASTGAQNLAAANGIRGASTTIAGLAPGTTYHFRIVAENSAGVSLGADRTFTTAITVKTIVKTIVKTRRPTAAPKITNVTQSHRVWRESRRLATFARRRRWPVGTTFSFSLNERATISFAFKRQVTGRKVRGRCVARTRSNRRRHACRRTVVRSMAPFAGHVKRNKVSFFGYLSRGKRLPPGSYTLVITAISAGLRSSPKSLSFTIVR